MINNRNNQEEITYMSESSDWAVVFRLTPLCEQTASVVQWKDTHFDTAEPFLGDIVTVTIVFKLGTVR